MLFRLGRQQVCRNVIVHKRIAFLRLYGDRLFNCVRAEVLFQKFHKRNFPFHSKVVAIRSPERGIETTAEVVGVRFPSIRHG